MKKVLFSAAAIAVFLNVSPANAWSPYNNNKATVQTWQSIFGPNWKQGFASAEAPAQAIIKNLKELADIIKKTDSLDKDTQDAIAKSLKGDFQKCIKYLAEFGDHIEDAQKESRIKEAQENTLKYLQQDSTFFGLDQTVALVQNDTLSQYSTIKNLIDSMHQYAQQAVTALNNTINSAQTNNTSTLFGLVVTLKDYYQTLVDHMTIDANNSINNGNINNIAASNTKPLQQTYNKNVSNIKPSQQTYNQNVSYSNNTKTNFGYNVPQTNSYQNTGNSTVSSTTSNNANVNQTAREKELARKRLQLQAMKYRVSPY